MMDMVERVARAIDATGKLGVSLAFTSPAATDTETIRKARISDTERAMTMARAAIEAMREPTVAMAEAGKDGILPQEVWPSAGEAAEAWRLMIDAALTPVHAPIG